jgi:hypothetical protein
MILGLNARRGIQLRNWRGGWDVESVERRGRLVARCRSWVQYQKPHPSAPLRAGLLAKNARNGAPRCGPTVIPQDVVPLKTVQSGVSFPTEPCKRRRDKSAPWKSLQPISTFAPLLLRRISWILKREQRPERSQPTRPRMQNEESNSGIVVVDGMIWVSSGGRGVCIRHSNFGCEVGGTGGAPSLGFGGELHAACLRPSCRKREGYATLGSAM